MKSNFFNYLFTFLKVLWSVIFISYLVAVVYFFMNSYNHVDSPNLTLQERIKGSLITPIALIIWFIDLIYAAIVLCGSLLILASVITHKS